MCETDILLNKLIRFPEWNGDLRELVFQTLKKYHLLNYSHSYLFSNLNLRVHMQQSLN